MFFSPHTMNLAVKRQKLTNENGNVALDQIQLVTGEEIKEQLLSTNPVQFVKEFQVRSFRRCS